tara:strand:- start:4449 stop:5693 length:1245 start_codon:yes stop_codon:yes gene_type:complete
MDKKPKKKPNVLYITYDGLLDPLGESQILPYLFGLRSTFNSLRIISFEKPYLSKKLILQKRKILKIHNIYWSPLVFSDTSNILFKILDLLKMYAKAIFLNIRFKYDVIHCRSYQAMKVGMLLKKYFKLKTIFDMRGLWVDDRLDGGRWPQNNIFYKLIYIYWKFIEKKLLENSDYIIALTPQTKLIINQIMKKQMKNIFIIPCCADFNHFNLIDKDKKEIIRRNIGISKDSLVLSYLGSIGTFYLWEKMLTFFLEVNKKYPESYFLVITKNWDHIRQESLEKKISKSIINKIIIKSASRDEVPRLLGVSDLMLSFRKNSFSQKACSPTKIGEAFACGVPVIANRNVGDVNNIINSLNGGQTINLDSKKEIDNIINNIEIIKSKGGSILRMQSEKLLGLRKGINLYKSIYEKITK